MGLEQYRVKVETEKNNKVVFADILNGIDDSWSVVEKAKYIHDCICRVSTYDERFIFSSNPELLRAIYNNEVNVDIPMTPIFICKALNEIYSEFKILTKDELREVDIRTGYLKPGGIYSDNVFELIADEIKQTSELRKTLINIPDIVKDYLVMLGINNAKSFSEDQLKQYVSAFTIDDIMRIKIMVLKYFKLQDFISGAIERKKHYKDLFRSVFTRMERKMFSCFDMIKEKGDTFEVLSVIRMKLKNEGTVYYVYSEKTHQYEPISIEDVHLIARDYKSYQDLELLAEVKQK